MGVIGSQLYAHSWGIDRTFLGETYTPKSKSIGNSQVLNRDYFKRDEIEVVIREMGDQVATRLRRENLSASSISLWVGYSLSYIDEDGRKGFSKQINVDATHSSKQISEYLLQIFNKNYYGQVVRNIGVTCSKLEPTTHHQISLFEDTKKLDKYDELDKVVDTIRQKHGFTKLVYASSLLKGGRAIERSSLVGGHAGGMSGIEGKNDEKK